MSERATDVRIPSARPPCRTPSNPFSLPSLRAVLLSGCGDRFSTYWVNPRRALDVKRTVETPCEDG